MKPFADIQRIAQEIMTPVQSDTEQCLPSHCQPVLWRESRSHQLNYVMQQLPSSAGYLVFIYHCSTKTDICMKVTGELEASLSGLQGLLICSSLVLFNFLGLHSN